MSDKKSKKKEKLSEEENELIKFLNDYLEKNGSPFRTKSIILIEKDVPNSSGAAFNKLDSGHINVESFQVFPGSDLNLTHTMSVCNPLTKPHCQHGQAVCIINYGSAPYWECPD